MYMTSEIALQLLINGILIGGVYGILSVGLTMIFGVLNVVNFAHGEFIMIAMYAAYWTSVYIHSGDTVTILIMLPAFFVFGFLVAKYIINPLINAPEMATVFTTLGIGIVLQNTALLLWSADPRSKTGVGMSLNLGDLMISYPRLRAFLIAIMVIIILALFMKLTYIGKAIRASAQNRLAAAIVGVNLDLICAIAFGLGTALIAVSGVLLLPIYAATPMVGAQFGILCFVAVVLGGLGSIPGALVGGLIIGITESFSGFLIDPSLKFLVIFIIFLVVLIFKPQGLWGSPYRH